MSRSSIAVDVGSSSIKAALIGEDGARLVESQVPLHYSAADGRMEIEAERLWEAFVRAVLELGDRIGEPKNISGFGIASQMAGVCLLREDGLPVRSFIPGVDRRGDRGIAVLEKKLGRTNVYETTGCPLTGIYPSSKLIVLAEEEPAVFRAAGMLGGFKEYLIWRLTGEWLTDPASASATQLYDQRVHNWWGEAVDAVDCVHLRLPKIVDPDTVAGPMKAEAAKELRLPPALPVAVGTGDGPASNLSTGSVFGKELCISFGTTCVIRYASARCEPFEANDSLFSQHFSGNTYLNGLRLDGVGRQIDVLLAEMSDDVLIPEPMGRGNLFYDPLQLTDCRFIGDLASASAWGKLAAVQEGILFALYGATAGIRERIRFGSIRPIGGGSRNAEWMRQLADLFQLPVVLVSGGDSTLGAAMTAMKGIGVFSDWGEAVRSMVRIDQVLEPDSVNGVLLRERYEAYEKVVYGRTRNER